MMKEVKVSIKPKKPMLKAKNNSDTLTQKPSSRKKD